MRNVSSATTWALPAPEGSRDAALVELKVIEAIRGKNNEKAELLRSSIRLEVAAVGSLAVAVASVLLGS